ncbi:MAG: hypothetical protein IPK63_15545 [Candidatus Competibacteraceae bacterium]|nr:hypothetical protein [Candidatus Competibacteraceae bacterium]
MGAETNLPLDFIGKTFRHYSGGREYKIIDIHQTRALSDGRLIHETFITRSSCNGQIVEGAMPLAAIKRSIILHDWV